MNIGKLLMSFYVWMYRRTKGKFGGSLGAFKVLLLTTKGRKSGNMHTNPVGYFERDGGYLIVASNRGLPKNPAWYYNIQGNPNDITIEVNDKQMKVKPEIILGEPRKPLYAWVASIAPNFGEYEKHTTREIPLVFLKAQ